MELGRIFYSQILLIEVTSFLRLRSLWNIFLLVSVYFSFHSYATQRTKVEEHYSLLFLLSFTNIEQWGNNSSRKISSTHLYTSLMRL